MGLLHESTRPIFLMGNIRSGTSLLSRMLNSHPEICVPYESHIYNVFWRFRDRYEPLTDPTRRRHLVNDVLAMRVFRDWSRPPDAESVMKCIERANFHGVFEAVMRAWADDQKKPRWGEKTPHNGPYWRAISEGFPDAQFIHLVRDGRDCTLSMIKARFGPKLTYPAAVKWANYLDEMQRMYEGLGPSRVYEVRYEDLLDNPEQTLQALCEFLGERYDPAMLDYHARPDNYMTDRRNRKNLKKPVIKDNKQKWEKSMSPRNQRLFEAVAGTQLERHGYPRICPDVRIHRWERWLYGYLLHPPLRALAMIRNTKGWIDGLIRVRVKLRLMMAPHHRSKPFRLPA